MFKKLVKQKSLVKSNKQPHSSMSTQEWLRDCAPRTCVLPKGLRLNFRSAPLYLNSRFSYLKETSSNNSHWWSLKGFLTKSQRMLTCELLLSATSDIPSAANSCFLPSSRCFDATDLRGMRAISLSHLIGGGSRHDAWWGHANQPD